MLCFSPRPGLLAAAMLPLIAASAALRQAPAEDRGLPTPEAAFLTENQAAMEHMMAGMTVPPSGDVDDDFVAMMVPHHQGAIDMAVAELRHGQNERLRRIAQEIIVTQQQEIVAMKLAVGQVEPGPGHDQHHQVTEGDRR